MDAGLDPDAGNDPGDGGALDGALDAGRRWPARCFVCHGSGTIPAPPLDTRGNRDTTFRGVGAHRSHMEGDEAWHRRVVCEDCHTVPTSRDDPGHRDTPLPAELTWGAVATADRARPAFDGATTTCAGVYCHGDTLMPGGSLTTPDWTAVGDGQAACGTCHGLPPSSPHPADTNCSTCHPTVDASWNFLEPQRHIDGVLDLRPGMSCTGCHGSGREAAPPRDVSGNTAPTARGVGAHRSHLGRSSWHREVTCGACHLVPGTEGDPGHRDTDLPAELTWGALSTADGASPDFDGPTTTCAGVYCHGGTLLPGGTNTTPDWTRVGAGEATCGTCHGLPPSAPHPAATDCATCHPTVAADRSFPDPSRHIDGVVDLDTSALTCTSCHGSGMDPAPPTDTSGRTATTERGVGAHQSHLGSSPWRATIQCADCHIVPSVFRDPGHTDSALPAELTFGMRATADGATPAFDGATTTCSGVYCHGETLIAGGTHTTPDWTRVGAGEARCGTCHGLPPSAPHPANANCSMCHPTIDPDDTFPDPERHVDGIVDLVAFTCTSCHGGTDGPAPPMSTTGAVSTSEMGVGAHQSHLAPSLWRAPIDCTECHIVPTSISTVGHLDTALPAELTFGARANADMATPRFSPDTGSCAGVYCHGETLLSGGTNTTPEWTSVGVGEASCGTCHGLPPAAPHPNVTNCATCHPTIAPDRSFLDPSRHIDGIVDLDTTALTCTSCHGSGTDPAPPTDTSGNSSTTAAGVGAHRSHLGPSDWRATVRCTDCHTVPSVFSDAGHIDSPLPAELTFGSRARADGASPRFERSTTTCAGVYCHGATLIAGGTQTTPDWTRVGSGEAACGTCHGLPPSAPHPANTHCSMCHPSIASDRSFPDPERHVNGVVDVVSFTCTSCHGSGSNPAPPRSTTGGTSTTTTGVGAHRSHLGASSWRAPIPCSECHLVPTSTFALGHLDTPLPAELRFGARARADGATPTFDRGTRTCADVYCHGETLLPGGSNTTPTWTRVGAGEAGCGTCHGLPPGGTHTSLTACEICHSEVVGPGMVITAPSLHIDGVVQVRANHPPGWSAPTSHGAHANQNGLASCQSCHGVALDGGAVGVSCASCHPADWQTNCTFCHGGTFNTTGAPPEGIDGETARSDVAVGAHTEHVSITHGILAGCDQCHVVPTSALAPGHIDGDGRAELTFGPLNPDATYDRTTATCSSVYCHRARPMVWTDDLNIGCMECHAM